MVPKLVATIERDACGMPHIVDLRSWGWMDALAGLIRGRKAAVPMPVVSEARVVDYAIDIPEKLFGILLSDKEPSGAESRRIRLVLLPPPALPEPQPHGVESI